MKIKVRQSLVRQLNRSSILDIIREKGPVSRTYLARELSLSKPTVMRVVNQLIDDGLVFDYSETESSGGRPRGLIGFNAKDSAVIGIDLGGTKMYGTISDLGGNIQEEIYQTWDEEGKKNSVDRVCELIGRLLAAPRTSGQKVRGIGIGAPGITYFERGVVAWAPSLGWRDLPLKKIIEDRFGLPVIVENDVNLAALGEFGFGAAKGASSLVCLAIGTGIGAGIVIDRKIYRGFHQAAGEIGYLLPDISYLNRTYEEFGALESITSGTGIAERGQALLHKLGRSVPEHGLTAEDVFQSARNGETWAQEVIDESVKYLSLAIATISELIDPEVIVLGGGVARSADILIQPIYNQLKGVIPSQPNIIQSTLGFRAAVMGAILLVLDETTEHVSVERLG